VQFGAINLHLLFGFPIFNKLKVAFTKVGIFLELVSHFLYKTYVVRSKSNILMNKKFF